MVDVGIFRGVSSKVARLKMKKRGGHGPCKQGCLVMKNNPLNSRFEICIVRGARGENVGAKCSNLATLGPFGLNNVARDDRSAKPKASVKPVSFS